MKPKISEISVREKKHAFCLRGTLFLGAWPILSGMHISEFSILRCVFEHYFRKFPSGVHGRLLYSEGAGLPELIKQHKQPNGFSKVMVLRRRHETFLTKVSCRVHETAIC